MLLAPGAPAPMPGRARCRAVQQVAQDPERLDITVCEQRIQPFQIVRGAPGRQADTGTPEDIGLAQVQIGDQQRTVCRAIQRTFAEQFHGFAGQLQLHAIAHACAPVVRQRARRAPSSLRYSVARARVRPRAETTTE